MRSRWFGLVIAALAPREERGARRMAQNVQERVSLRGEKNGTGSERARRQAQRQGGPRARGRAQRAGI